MRGPDLQHRCRQTLGSGGARRVGGLRAGGVGAGGRRRWREQQMTKAGGGGGEGRGSACHQPRGLHGTAMMAGV